MRFLCMACEEGMTFEEATGPEEGSVTIVFRCQTCGAGVAMLTNPGETRLVQALGVRVGGRDGEAALLETTSGLIDSGSSLPWTREAEERIERVPAFVRPMVRIAVERIALAANAPEVTGAHVAAAGESMGHRPS